MFFFLTLFYWVFLVYTSATSGWLTGLEENVQARMVTSGSTDALILIFPSFLLQAVL